jgi:flagellin
MSDIVLSQGVRSNLLQLQQTSDLITQTQERLATGKKVNSALDNPINYFTAQSLSTRANNFNALLDTMSTAINTIQAANNGISSLTKLVQSAQAIVNQAQQTTDPTTLSALATQFDSLRTQIDQLAGDSGLNGVNLLDGDTLTVTLNDSGTSTVSVSGVNDLCNGALAINASVNNWASATDIATAASQLTTALTTLRTQSQNLSSNLQTVQVRQDFTKAMVNTLKTGADDLTLADTNEEGANLLALQTRQQLSTTALSLAAQADQNVLRLFQ